MLLLWSSLFIAISVQSQLINQFIEGTGPKGEDTWNSTSDFIPQQAQSFGSIKIGLIMSIEFDFVFHGRRNSPTVCPNLKNENFFRIGNTAQYSTGCVHQGSHYPSFSLAPNCDAEYLQIGFTTRRRCPDTLTLSDYGNGTLSTTHAHHIEIYMNTSQIVVKITGGGQPDYVAHKKKYGTPMDFVNQSLPVWFMSNKRSNQYNVGDGTFSNIKIVSKWAPYPMTPVPTHEPTTSPSNRPTDDPTQSLVMPTDAPTKYPTLVPTSQPTTFPSTKPSATPSNNPTTSPSMAPIASPSVSPTRSKTTNPSATPSIVPSLTSHPSMPPTISPTLYPSAGLIVSPTSNPTMLPSMPPSNHPTLYPTAFPTSTPSKLSSSHPTSIPSMQPTLYPIIQPITLQPSQPPTFEPTLEPTTFLPNDLLAENTTNTPTQSPSVSIDSSHKKPTLKPTKNPTSQTEKSELSQANVLLGAVIGFFAILLIAIAIYWYCRFKPPSMAKSTLETNAKTHMDMARRTSLSPKQTMSIAMHAIVSQNRQISASVSSKFSDDLTDADKSSAAVGNRNLHVIENSDDLVLSPKFGGYIASLGQSNHSSNATAATMTSDHGQQQQQQQLDYNEYETEITTSTNISAGDSEDMYNKCKTKGNDLLSEVLSSQSSDDEDLYRFEQGNEHNITKQNMIEMFEHDLQNEDALLSL